MGTLPKTNVIRVPPTPLFIVMTDRADGTLWVLSYATVDGLDYISINDQGLLKGADLGNTEWEDRRIYGAYEGPYFAIPDHIKHRNPRLQCRLLVRSGDLGYELVEPTIFAQNHRIIARRGLSRVYREIILPQGWLNFLGNGEFDIAAWEDNPEVT